MHVPQRHCHLLIRKHPVAVTIVRCRQAGRNMAQLRPCNKIHCSSEEFDSQVAAGEHAPSAVPSWRYTRRIGLRFVLRISQG